MELDVGNFGLFGLMQTTHVSQAVGISVSGGTVPATLATLAWMPMKKKKPNGIPACPRFFGRGRLSGVFFWVYPYTEIHSVSLSIELC
jgi:hypothetical protein